MTASRKVYDLRKLVFVKPDVNVVDQVHHICLAFAMRDLWVEYDDAQAAWTAYCDDHAMPHYAALPSDSDMIYALLESYLQFEKATEPA